MMTGFVPTTLLSALSSRSSVFLAGSASAPAHRPVTVSPRRAKSAAPVRVVVMGAKKIAFGEESRRALVKGINAVAEAVRITIGPRGRNVVLEKSYGAPQVVNDGVTIARDISLEDPMANTGARLLQEVASKTDSKAGDGTTTSTVLCQAIINEGMKAVSSGRNPIALKRGIERTSKKLIQELKEMARESRGIDDIRNVATISAGNDAAIGEIIASAYEKIGINGSTSVEESQSLNDELQFTEGMELDRGFISPYFVKDQERQICDMKSPRILITDRKISALTELVPLLEQIIKSKKKEPLVIISDEISGEALSTLVLNKMRGVLDVVAVKSPGFGDRRKAYLQDIAILTGGTYYAEELNYALEDVKVEDLGKAERIIVGKEVTTIISTGENQDAIAARIEQIKKEVEASDSKFDQEKGEERVARLTGGIARILCGAATETELKDKKLRYEDALNATKAAMEQGVVPGGGAALVHLADKIPEWAKDLEDEDERVGATIVQRAISEPFKQICANAGREGEVILSKVKEMKFGGGYNAATNTYEDLFDAGVIDPAKVTCWALENASSIAGLVLTTECLIVDIPEKKSSQGDGMGNLPGENYY